MNSVMRGAPKLAGAGPKQSIRNSQGQEENQLLRTNHSIIYRLARSKASFFTFPADHEIPVVEPFVMLSGALLKDSFDGNGTNAADAGETLYNGIVLPRERPPRLADFPTSVEKDPVVPPYLFRTRHPRSFPSTSGDNSSR